MNVGSRGKARSRNKSPCGYCCKKNLLILLNIRFACRMSMVQFNKFWFCCLSKKCLISVLKEFFLDKFLSRLNYPISWTVHCWETPLWKWDFNNFKCLKLISVPTYRCQARKEFWPCILCPRGIWARLSKLAPRYSVTWAPVFALSDFIDLSFQTFSTSSLFSASCRSPLLFVLFPKSSGYTNHS